ncbi:MAG: DUF2085 domain-containing protein [Anaerolineae bacterium]|nr:DUF2085 domain-containing protein [Anaerolineae bacterium]
MNQNSEADRVKAYPFSTRVPTRWWYLLLIAGVLVLLGFYNVSDPSRVAHDPLLETGDYAGYAICHRITERSFTVAGRQFPLCARCTGTYLGVGLAFGILILAGRGRRAGLPPLPVLLVLGSFIAAMGVDGVNSYAHFSPEAPHLYEPRNWLRLLTGMGTGLAMGLVVAPALAQTLWREPKWHPSVASLRELAGIVVVALVTIALVLSNLPPLSYVLAIVSAAAVVLIIAVLNIMFLLIVTRRDGWATRWRQVAPFLAAGVVLAMMEIALIGIGRYALTGTMTGFPGL